MRTILAAVLLAVLIVTGVAIVGPLIARPMIVAAIERESPFGDQHLDIDVDCNVFGLLQGSIDRVHVHGTDLKRGDVTIGDLDITAWHVATSGRSFDEVNGGLASVNVPIDDDSGLTISTVDLDGSSASLDGIVFFDHAGAMQLVETALADASLDVQDIRIGNDLVMFRVLGTDAVAQIGLEDGSIVLVDPFGQGSFPLVAPKATDAWTITRASLSWDGLRFNVTIDAGKLLADW